MTRWLRKEKGQRNIEKGNKILNLTFEQANQNICMAFMIPIGNILKISLNFSPFDIRIRPDKSILTAQINKKSLTIQHLFMQASRILTVCVLLSLYLAVVNSSCTSTPLPDCYAVDGLDTLGVTTANCGCLSCQWWARRLLNYTCQPCSIAYPNCATCDLTTCTACFGGSSFNQSVGHLICYNCQTIMVGCNSCNWTSTPHKCLNCFGDWFFNASLICERCDKYMPYCGSCNNNFTCISCVRNWGFSAPSVCSPCGSNITGCEECSFTHVCAGCVYGSILTNNNTACGACVDFMPHCNTCSSPTECSDCDLPSLGVNYTVTPNTCVLCTLNLTNCIDCSYYTFCTQCVNNSYCPKYMQPRVQVCVTCDVVLEGCSTCSGPTACLSCIDNLTFLHNPAEQRCVHCDYYLTACLICTLNRQCYGCYGNRHLLNHVAHLCDPCSAFMNSCYECNSETQCTKCLYGRLVPDKTGCTNIKGCISVQPLYSVGDNCLACDPYCFYPAPQYGKCICVQGWIVGNLCTTIIGCTATVKVSMHTLCVACDSFRKFLLVNGTCVCKQYYELFGTSCRQICGDGYLVNAACDDGNKINGDGCSSTCQVEEYHECKNDKSVVPASKCQFRARVGLYLASIEKQAANTAKITLDIAPYSEKIKQMNFSTFIDLNVDGCKVTTVQIVDTQLIVTFKYTNNINHAPASIIMDFDHAFVLSPKTKINFLMDQSTGLSLQYAQQFVFGGSSAMLLLSLSLVSLAVFALGSIAFKIIGVETIYPIQISWVLFSTSKYYKIFFVNFNSLNYSYGQIPLQSNGEHLSSRFGNLGFTNELSDGYFFYSAAHSIIIVLFVSASVYRFKLKEQMSKMKKQKQNKENKENFNKKQMEVTQEKIDKVNRLLSILYNWVVFPIMIGFILHLLQTVYSNQFNNISDQTNIFYGFTLLLGFLTTSFVFHSQICKLKWQQETNILKQAKNNLYIPYFLIHNLLLFILLTTILIKNQQIYTYYAAIAMVVLHMGYLIIKRPYQSGFSNFSIIFNQLAVLFSFFWVFSKGTSIDNLKNTTLFVYGFIGVMFLVNGFGMIRSAIVLKDVVGDILLRKKEDMDNKQNKTPQQQGQINFNMIKQDIKQNISDEKSILNKYSYQALQNPFLNKKDSQLSNLISGTNKRTHLRNARLNK